MTKVAVPWELRKVLRCAWWPHASVFTLQQASHARAHLSTCHPVCSLPSWGGVFVHQPQLICRIQTPQPTVLLKTGAAGILGAESDWKEQRPPGHSETSLRPIKNESELQFPRSLADAASHGIMGGAGARLSKATRMMWICCRKSRSLFQASVSQRGQDRKVSKDALDFAFIQF